MKNGSLGVPDHTTEDVLDFTVSDIDVPEVCLKGIRVLNNVPDFTPCPAHPPPILRQPSSQALATSLCSHAMTTIFICAYVNFVIMCANAWVVQPRPRPDRKYAA